MWMRRLDCRRTTGIGRRGHLRGRLGRKRTPGLAVNVSHERFGQLRIRVGGQLTGRAKNSYQLVTELVVLPLHRPALRHPSYLDHTAPRRALRCPRRQGPSRADDRVPVELVSDYDGKMFVQWPLAKTFPVGDAGMVAAKHPLAAEVGVRTLRSGGTAVDAAVATSLASGVVEPYMSGVGGGGLAVYHSRDGASLALHFGMQAPSSAHADMYRIIPGTHDVELFGWPRTVGDANVSGPTSIAVPGLVPGLYRLWQAGGRLPWRELVEPARALAANGFPVDWLTSLRTLEGQDLLSRFPASRAIFLARGRAPKPELGRAAEILRQADLGATLDALAGDPDALTDETIAGTIARATDGRLTRTDLAGRSLLEGQPLAASFEGLEVRAVPWATGGATVLEWLGILEALDPPRDEADPRFWSAVIKAGEVAMHDRLEKLGDPRQVHFPDEILDPSYHRRMARAIEAG